MGASSTSSSDVDDEEAERLRSVAVDSAAVAGVAGVAAALSKQQPKRNKKKKDNLACSDDEGAPSSLKFYQARARDHLHEYLDKTFNIKFVKYEECEVPDVHVSKDAEDVGFHLFKTAPSGLSDNKRHSQEAVSTLKRKRHDHNPDESSEMFQASLSATAIDGTTVALYAEKAKAKAFALWVLHQATEKETKRKEEERISLLKAQRGEQWLPSVARALRIDSVVGSSSPVRVAIDNKKCNDLRRKDANQKLKKQTVKGRSSGC